LDIFFDKWDYRLLILLFLDHHFYYYLVDCCYCYFVYCYFLYRRIHLDHLFESLESLLIYVYEGFLMEVEGMDSEESGVPEDFQFVSNHDEEMIRDVSDPLDAHFARVGNCLLWKFLKSYVAEQEKLQNEANERDVQDLEYKIQRARSNS